MPCKSHALALVVVVATSWPGAALAGPPYVTDDPEPTDTGRWEVYGFGSDSVSRHGLDGESGFDINYGGGEDLQLSAVVSSAYQKEDGAPAAAGLADLELGAKYRFMHQRDGSWTPDVALFPKIELPTAGRRFGPGRVGCSIPVWAQKDFGAWSVFGGGGWTLNPGTGNRNFGFGGVAVTRGVMKTLTIGAELYHQTSDAIGTRASTGLGVGASWRVAPRWSIIGSGGPLIRHRETPDDYAVYLALEFHD